MQLDHVWEETPLYSIAHLTESGRAKDSNEIQGQRIEGHGFLWAQEGTWLRRYKSSRYGHSLHAYTHHAIGLF